jgi:predicted dehydrogenase
MSQTQEQIAFPALSKDSNPRLAFVGVGWIGWHRMKSLAESGLANIHAIVEPQLELARRAQQLAPRAEILTGFDEALRSGVDGIVIATPSAAHSEQTIRALQKGIAVFCQKPLGINSEETRRCIDAARAADRLLAVDLSYRFVDGVAKIRNLIECGELGDIFSVELTFHNAYGPDKSWFYDPRLSGGGCLMDLGIHLIDTALWLLDFPAVEEVSGNLYANGRPFAGRDLEVEDFVQATLSLETSATVRLSCSWRAHAGQDAMITISVYGTKGGAKLSNVEGSFYDFVAEHYTGTTRRTIAVPPDAWGGRAALNWLTRLRQTNRFDPAIQQLSSVARVLDWIYKQ